MHIYTLIYTNPMHAQNAQNTPQLKTFLQRPLSVLRKRYLNGEGGAIDKKCKYFRVTAKINFKLF